MMDPIIIAPWVIVITILALVFWATIIWKE